MIPGAVPFPLVPTLQRPFDYCHRGIANGDIRDLPRQRDSRACARPFGSRLSAEVADILSRLRRAKIPR